MSLLHYRIVQVQGYWRIDINGNQQGCFPTRADAVRSAIQIVMDKSDKPRRRQVRRAKSYENGISQSLTSGTA